MAAVKDSEQLLINPPLQTGDITISIEGVVANLPFALVESGRSPIAITLTAEQAASSGVISIRDQTTPPAWVGPFDEAGPFVGTGTGENIDLSNIPQYGDTQLIGNRRFTLTKGEAEV